MLETILKLLGREAVLLQGLEKPLHEQLQKTPAKTTLPQALAPIFTL